MPADRFVFRGWLDTRAVPIPGDKDRTNDTVARLDNAAEHGVPWALAVEFQTQPDPDMFSRLMGYLSELRLALYPDPERGSRFHVGAAVAGGNTPELVDRWKVAADAEPTARRRGEFARVAKVFAERVGRKAIWYEKLEGWNVEESPVVNEWIAEAEGGTLLRLATKRFGPAPADVESVILKLKDRKRVERMLDRIFDTTGWSDLLATP